MAVRVFDHVESPTVRLRVVEPAPLRRQDVRRSRHRWMWLAVSAMAVPFAAAVIVLEATH